MPGLGLRELEQAFIADKIAQGLSPHTIGFYRRKLKPFLAFCDGESVFDLQSITVNLLRAYMAKMAETHSPGGSHALYRPLHAWMLWLEAEEVIPNWKSPIRRVRPPRVHAQPIDAISQDDIAAMLRVCESAEMGYRDRAIISALYDTGARAREFLDMDLNDLTLATGAILIRRGKSNRARVVYLGSTSRRAVRHYLSSRDDACPALWITNTGERMGYNTLRLMLQRRAIAADVDVPTPHDFRRAFALNMLRNGADVYSIRRLMGHADMQILQRYLAQTDEDSKAAHLKGSPMDHLQG